MLYDLEDACSGTTANSRLWRQYWRFSYPILVYRISSASAFPGILKKNETRDYLFAPCSPANFGKELLKPNKDMKMRTKEMKTKTIALSLGLILVAGGLYAADPFEGTWKLNESKSKLTPGTDKDTKIVYNSRLIRDKVTVTADGVEGDGTPIHSEWKGKFDGKDYEVTGDPDADMRSYTKMNDRTLSMVAKKGGEVVAQGLIIVSADGKSQEVNLTSPDAVMDVYKEKGKEKSTEKAKGKGFRNKAVYDKG